MALVHLDEAAFLASKGDEWSRQDMDAARDLIPALVVFRWSQDLRVELDHAVLRPVRSRSSSARWIAAGWLAR